MEHGRPPYRQEAARTARRRLTVSALALAIATAPAAAAADRASIPAVSARATPAPAVVPGELLVRFKGGAGAAERADARRRADAQLAQRLPVRGLELVRVDAQTAVAEALDRLTADPDVAYAEPNRYRSASRTPNDPHFAELWGLHNTGQAIGGTSGTPDADVDAPEAWDVTTGTPAVAVAVVDSGIARTHPDLAPNLWTNSGETGAVRQSNGIDDDRNGYVDDTGGWDWVDGDANPSDANGHGTHVAGTAGARGDNAAGVAGVAWRASLMPLRTLDAEGSGTVADAIRAYAYAADEGARVLNASFGGPGFSRAEYDAIRAIPDVLFVAAAGNDGSDNDSVAQFPCNYDLPHIVCVAATGQRDRLASFSNWGAATVDLAAPGTSILSTWPGGYAYSSGTSMATPHVSGAAALAFAAQPAATPASVKAALLAGVDPRPALTGVTVTGGRLNAHTILVGPSPPAPGPGAAPASSPPAAAPDRTPPQIRIRVRSRQALRTLLRRGIRASVACSEACVLRARALIRRRTARRQGSIASALAVAGRKSTALASSGRRTLVIRLRRTAKRQLRRTGRATLELKVNARDTAGNARAAKRVIRVRRNR